MYTKNVKNLLGKNITYVLLLAIFALGFNLSGGLSHKTSPSKQTDEKLIVVDKKPDGGKGMLQLDKLEFITVTPSPTTPPIPTQPQVTNPPYTPPTPTPSGNFCEKNALKTSDCECQPGQFPHRRLNCNNPDACDPYGWAKINKTPPPNSCSYIENKDSVDGFNFYYKYSGCSEDPQLYCASKPIIYLYPEEKTIVDVRLDIPGEVIVSDPLYPTGGWRNVEAHPDGTLIYQGKKYRELYYESTFEDLKIPKNGNIIAKKDLEKELKTATTKLGLNSFEQKEFLDYWVERLNGLNSPYILFSIIDPLEKERIDHVEIKPEPDTRIEFLAYFKPLSSKTLSGLVLSEAEGVEGLTPLILPNIPPQRIGFTIVEWGGIVDQN